MMVFDLECSKGHSFEGWFDGLHSFEEQNSKNLIRCPVCNDSDIRKILSPVAVKKSQPKNDIPQGTIDYRKLAKEIVDYVQTNFEDVGTNFTSEALKMHYNVTEKRSIRGSATSEEEKTLKDEGIDFFKIPLPEGDKTKKN